MFLFTFAYAKITQNNISDYFLQVSAYDQKQDALNYANQIQQKLATPTRVHKTDKNGKVVYEVQIGPFHSEKMLHTIQQKLDTKKIASFIRKYPVNNNNLTIALSKIASIPENVIPTIKISKAKTFPIKTIKTNPEKKHPAQKQPEQTRLWNLHNADIRSVINEVSRETGKNFIIDPRVQGKISIVSSTPISAKGIYQVFLSALQVLGFSAVPNGKVIKIVPSMEAKELASPIATPQKPGKGNEMVVRIIAVRNVSAEQLVPILRPLMPNWAQIAAYEPSNVLIIAGHANNVTRLVKIVEQVDVANTDGIDVIPLHYAYASDIVSTLKDLAQANRGITPKVSLAADDTANTILISGDKNARLKMRILISELDTPSASGANANTQVIYLHFLKAQDLVPILAGVARSYYSGEVGTVIGAITKSKDYAAEDTGGDSGIEPTGTAGLGEKYLPQMPATTSQTQQTATTTTTNGQGNKGKPKVEIIAEPYNNSIIINAPPAVMRTLKSVIAKLDKRPTQVLVEALIAEVDVNTSHNLGIQWGTVTDVNQNSSANNAVSAAFQQGIGIITGKGLGSLTGIITALRDDRNSNILSTPSILVLNNHQAKILVGKQISVEQSTFPGNADGTTTATPFTTFSRLNVALHLYVTPQISQGDTIQLSIDQGNDTLANPDDVSTTPEVNTSSIKTSVMVNSGDIIVLGGLIQNELSTSVNGLPILSHVPVLGYLFGNHGRNKQKQNLMVFIRPIIIHSGKDSLSLTGEKYNYIRHQELQWLRDEHHYDPDTNQHVLPPWGKQPVLPPPFAQ